MSVEPAKTREQAIDDFEWMRSHYFPRWRTLGDGELEEWVSFLQRVSRSVLDVAVPEHFRARGSFTSPVLKELRAKCIEVHRRQRPPATITTNPANRERIIDWIRRESLAPKPGDPFNQQPESDREAIVRHYSNAWRSVKDPAVTLSGDYAKIPPADDYGRQYARGMIFSHCLAALLEIKVPAGEARDIAECVVDLKEGERVVLRTTLKSPEPPARASTPREQMVALAKSHVAAEEMAVISSDAGPAGQDASP